MKDRKYIPIVFGGYINAYAIIRGFYEEGIRSVSVIGNEPCFFRKSKFIDRQIKVADFDDNDARFVEDMIALGKQLRPNKGILFPTHDDQLMVLAKNREKLEKYFIFPFSDFSLLEMITTKSSFTKLCKKSFVPTIKDSIIDERNIMDIPQLRFPIIVKTSSANDEKHKVTKYIATEEEYKSFAKSVIVAGIKVDLLAQEFIPESEHCQLTVNGIGDGKGNVLGYMVFEKVRQQPPKTGLSSAYRVLKKDEFGYDRVVRYACNIIKSTKLLGLFGVEFKYDERDDEYYVIEMNPRSEFANYLQTANGCNMAYLLTKYFEMGTMPAYKLEIKYPFARVPFTDYFRTVCFNRYVYPKYALSKKEWKKSIEEPCILYGVTKEDFFSFINEYIYEIKRALISMYRYKHRVPTGIRTKDYLRKRLQISKK